MRYLKYLFFSYLSFKILFLVLIAFFLYKGYSVLHETQAKQEMEVQKYLHAMDSLRNVQDKTKISK